MEAKDFKIGWTVRALSSIYASIGLRKGETAMVADISTPCVGVRHARNDGVWYMNPSELEVLKPRLPSISDDLRLTPQAKGILAHLKRHAAGISPAEALVAYSVSRLASCIHEIRKRAGYDVKTVVKQDDHGHKYARYSLVIH